MSTPREQHDAMLDDLDPETKLRLLGHVPFAKLLEEIDPVAYRCSVADFQAVCDSCGREFWPDDPDEEAVCDACKEEAEADKTDSGEDE